MADFDLYDDLGTGSKPAAALQLDDRLLSGTLGGTHAPLGGSSQLQQIVAHEPAQSRMAPSREAPPVFNVAVQGMSWWTTADDITRLMAKIGEVRLVHIYTDSATALSRGMAVVAFTNSTNATAALRLEGTVLNEAMLRVTLLHPPIHVGDVGRPPLIPALQHVIEDERVTGTAHGTGGDYSPSCKTWFHNADICPSRPWRRGNSRLSPTSVRQIEVLESGGSASPGSPASPVRRRQNHGYRGSWSSRSRSSSRSPSPRWRKRPSTPPRWRESKTERRGSATDAAKRSRSPRRETSPSPSFSEKERDRSHSNSKKPRRKGSRSKRLRAETTVSDPNICPRTGAPRYIPDPMPGPRQRLSKSPVRKSSKKSRQSRSH
eukprot:TRINITY_DN12364_c0_g1_i1.p1 TRINITY_DN12364_c0_g1~~TRINITY_DN12364_c0_g1_i1.p1  ORF type:complete len:385 (+),score=23.74 TRINITY_DN12364_c0_g1_i1:29-1156(+)